MSAAIDFYGSDITTFVDGVPDLDPLFGVISGQQTVQEVCARRLMTPNGSLDNYPSFGFDIRVYLNARMSPLKKARLKQGIEAELRKEQRVISATVQSNTIDAANLTMRLVISITLSTGKFTLTLGVDQVTVKILGVSS